MIIYKQTPHAGLGVFATRKIASGEMIEQVPVIVVPAAEQPLIAQTILDSYDFKWGEDGKSTAIALGMGSLYNHSHNPNALYRKRFADRLIEFIAIREIDEGDEIRINYNGRPDDPSPIVFDGLTWRK
jgi:SET domain-containing protein